MKAGSSHPPAIHEDGVSIASQLLTPSLLGVTEGSLGVTLSPESSEVEHLVPIQGVRRSRWPLYKEGSMRGQS